MANTETVSEKRKRGRPRKASVRQKPSSTFEAFPLDGSETMPASKSNRHADAMMLHFAYRHILSIPIRAPKDDEPEQPAI